MPESAKEFRLKNGRTGDWTLTVGGTPTAPGVAWLIDPPRVVETTLEPMWTDELVEAYASSRVAALEALLTKISNTVNLLPSVTGLSPVHNFSEIPLAIRDLQDNYADAARARNGQYTKSQAKVAALEQRIAEAIAILDQAGDNRDAALARLREVKG